MQDRSIIIMTVPFGSAHYRTARAIEKAWKSKERPTNVRVVRLRDYLPDRLVGALVKGYLSLIRFAPYLFRYGYVKGREPGFSDKALQLAVRLARPASTRLERFVNETPGIWVSTHPLTSIVAGSVGDALTARAVLITDHHFHAFWCFPGTAAYFVGRPAMRTALVSRGIPRRSVRLTGIPIDPNFSDLQSRGEIEAELGLSNSKFRILLMGGGLGIGPIEKIALGIVSLDRSIELVVVAGRNRSLLERLTKLEKNMIVLGYVNNMHSLMAASDLCLTKPGGLTIAEASAMGLPTVLFDPLPGHEEANSETLVREGSAFRLGLLERAPDLIEELMTRPSLLRRMGRKMRNFGRPSAAFDMADALEELWIERFEKRQR